MPNQTLPNPQIVHMLRRLNNTYLGTKAENITINSPLTVEHPLAYSRFMTPAAVCDRRVGAHYRADFERRLQLMSLRDKRHADLTHVSLSAGTARRQMGIEPKRDCVGCVIAAPAGYVEKLSDDPQS